MMGSFAALLIGLGVIGVVYLVSWAIAAAGAWCIQAFRKAVWTRALYIAHEHPETLAKVVPTLVELGVIVDTEALQKQVPRDVQKFLEAPTEVEVVTEEIPTLDLELDLTPAAEHDIYVASAQEAWARVRELEDVIVLLEAERDYKDELRARHLRRVRRIEEALEDPEADVYAAVHPFLARESDSKTMDAGKES